MRSGPCLQTPERQEFLSVTACDTWLSGGHRGCQRMAAPKALPCLRVSCWGESWRSYCPTENWCGGCRITDPGSLRRCRTHVGEFRVHDASDPLFTYIVEGIRLSIVIGRRALRRVWRFDNGHKHQLQASNVPCLPAQKGSAPWSSSSQPSRRCMVHSTPPPPGISCSRSAAGLLTVGCESPA